MNWPTLPLVPFIGLRPFESHESPLFFGRLEQSTELLQRLYDTHFVAVTGSSGCGKSSLVRAGLIPLLHAGFLVEDRDQWLIAKMKPGDQPLNALALALESILSAEPIHHGQLLAAIRASGLQAILSRLALALAKSDANVLLLVDQFEEVFRLGLRSAEGERREEAAEFVNLLLVLAEQRELPIYVVVTIRSDFLGDCDTFYGLPEAMNHSQFFVPRLTRQQRREAIEGPIKLYGAAIAPRLVELLLNEASEAGDQLPVLQHVLRHAWQKWQERPHGPISILHYNAVGTLSNAISLHGDQALQEMDDKNRYLTKRIFQTLIENDSNNRFIRRPTKLADIVAIAGAKVEEIWQIVEKFRHPDRSFLTVSSENPSENPVIDISHESLIRQWQTLKNWANEEGESARIYFRLTETARLFKEQKAVLLQDPELRVALQWSQTQRPNEFWAKRYKGDFFEVKQFLDESIKKKFTTRFVFFIIGLATIIIIFQWGILDMPREFGGLGLLIFLVVLLAPFFYIRKLFDLLFRLYLRFFKL